MANIISHFPDPANRVRCTAHIVNLVSKIILRQFDARKKPTTTGKKTAANDEANDENGNDKVNGNDTNTANENDEANDDNQDNEDHMIALAGDLDREEQEVADDEDGDMSGNMAADLEEIEAAMKDEILEVAKKVKPIQRVLFKVSTSNYIAYD